VPGILLNGNRGYFREGYPFMLLFTVKEKNVLAVNVPMLAMIKGGEF